MSDLDHGANLPPEQPRQHPVSRGSAGMAGALAMLAGIVAGLVYLGPQAYELVIRFLAEQGWLGVLRSPIVYFALVLLGAEAVTGIALAQVAWQEPTEEEKFRFNIFILIIAIISAILLEIASFITLGPGGPPGVGTHLAFGDRVPARYRGRRRVSLYQHLGSGAAMGLLETGPISLRLFRVALRERAVVP